MSVPFVSKSLLLEDYWRGIILFGRNVASYKFALAKTLLDLKPVSGQFITLEELAPIYTQHISQHLKVADKQSTSTGSKFLSACRNYNSGVLSQDELTGLTVQLGFQNVIDAFHNVGGDEIAKRFFLDERRGDGGIRITDNFSELVSNHQNLNLPDEIEARWRLVETAWALSMNRSLVSIQYDSESKDLYTKFDRSLRRTTVTGSREALNGYQKGRCFYCFCDIEIFDGATLLPDVDHFFPHVLKQHGFEHIIDGIWNLVLSCRECNRGVGGKFDRVPAIRLLERLYNRNEFLISSHHPLRETLMAQTGTSEARRRNFLNEIYGRSARLLIHDWDVDEKIAPPF